MGTAGPQPQAADLSVIEQMSVGTAGSLPRAPDLIGHCWTSIASDRCQWAHARPQWHCRT